MSPTIQMTLPFSSELMPLIIDGSKTLTYRVGKKYDDISLGDIVYVSESEGENIAEVKIVEKTYTQFGLLPLDRVGHEIYKSNQDKKETFRRHYGREILDTEEMIIFKFKIIKIL